MCSRSSYQRIRKMLYGRAGNSEVVSLFQEVIHRGEREMENHGDFVIESKAIMFAFVKDSYFALYVACNPGGLYDNDKGQPFITVMDHKERNGRCYSNPEKQKEWIYKTINVLLGASGKGCEVEASSSTMPMKKMEGLPLQRDGVNCGPYMIIDFIHVCDMLRGLRSDLEFLLFQTFLSLAYQDEWCHPKHFCEDMLKFIELLNVAHFKAKEAPLEIDSDGQSQSHLYGDDEESAMEENICKRPPEHPAMVATDATIGDPP